MTNIVNTGHHNRVPSLSASLELLKPITWFPPMWAYGCGVVSSGVSVLDNWHLALAGIMLAGPLVCATSQAVNDWYDRHVDAINQPERPIPSGRIPGRWGLYIAILWTGLSLLLAASLGTVVFGAAVFGLVLAWAYSAPPLRLKMNGWWGNSAVAICYEGLPWFTGTAALTLAMPDDRVLIAAALYSFGAHGIMTLNDFKSIEGDRKLGVGSLPARLGPERAAKLACIVMLIPQFVMVGFLLNWGAFIHGGIVSLFTLVQIGLMAKLLKDPRKLAPWYNGTGITLYVLGMLVTAFALRDMAGT